MENTIAERYKSIPSWVYNRFDDNYFILAVRYNHRCQCNWNKWTCVLYNAINSFKQPHRLWWICWKWTSVGKSLGMNKKKIWYLSMKFGGECGLFSFCTSQNKQKCLRCWYSGKRAIHQLTVIRFWEMEKEWHHHPNT